MSIKTLAYVLLVGISACLFTLVSRAGTLQVQLEEKEKISVTAKDVKLCDLLQEIKNVTQIRIPKVGNCEEVVNLKLKKVTLDKLFGTIFRNQSFIIKDNPNGQQLVILKKGDGQSDMSSGRDIQSPYYPPDPVETMQPPMEMPHQDPGMIDPPEPQPLDMPTEQEPQQ